VYISYLLHNRTRSYSCTNLGVYSRGHQFESRNEHQLSWAISWLWLSSVPRRISQECTVFRLRPLPSKCFPIHYPPIILPFVPCETWYQFAGSNFLMFTSESFLYFSHGYRTWSHVSMQYILWWNVEIRVTELTMCITTVEGVWDCGRQAHNINVRFIVTIIILNIIHRSVTVVHYYN
jgi:hypothetical protein